jgi:glyoxylase-like metal-dependent hydrolase (beta-lactamase superfamily II)
MTTQGVFTMNSLQVSTYLSGYKPIPNSLPDWEPGRQATWPATTATLISVDGQAVLIDSLMTITEGAELGRWIARSDVGELTSIYVTHGHADHFFGATTVLEQFPDARLVARPEVADAAREQTSAGYLQVWTSFFPGQLTKHPAAPNPLSGNTLSVGQHDLVTIDVGPTDIAASSVVHIPELDIVISGDVAYNGMHMWLAGSTAATRHSWMKALDAIEALHPREVITGHKDPVAPDDDAARILDESRSYLANFNHAAASCDSPRDLLRAVLDRYPHLGNPYTLWAAAHDQPEMLVRAAETHAPQSS